MNRSLKTASLAMIVSLCCTMFLSCSGSGTATVSINLNLPKNAAVLKSVPDTIIDRVLRLFSSAAYAAAPAEVTEIAIVVTGPGLSPFEGKYPADTEKVVLSVEAGKDRTFVLKAYNSAGDVIYGGSDTVDLESGETKELIIHMRVPLRMVANINATDSVDSSPEEMVVFKNKIYFSANEGTSSGRELWVYDPATGDCQMVYDINSGSGSSYPENLLVFNGKLYFAATDGSSSSANHGTELWVYDGTNDPALVYDINSQIDTAYGSTYSSNPNYLTIHNKKLYFSANDGVNGIELWEYDGKAVPAIYDVNIKMYDINTLPGIDSGPGFLTSYDGKLFFQASTDETGADLYYLEGDTVQPPYDIYLGTTGSFPSNFIVFDGNLYFTASDSISDGKITYHGNELWRYDGINDPVLLADINRQPGGPGETLDSAPDELTIMGNNLFFSANDGENGRELWMYDGVYPALLNVDVAMVADIYAAPTMSSSPRGLCAIDGLMYFSATDDLGNTSLYSYNPGTFETTPIMLMNYDLYNMVKLGEVIAFCDWNGDSLPSVVNIYDPTKPPDIGINPFNLAIMTDGTEDAQILLVQGNRLYMSADDGIHGKELWVYEWYE